MNNLITDRPSAEIVTASKALVEKLLSMNTRNRKPKSTNIERLRKDIELKEFMLTASGVGVSRTGVLLDGQNRLMAIRDSGYTPVKFVLVTGLDDASQRVVDRHAKRNLSDVLSMHLNITISSAMVALANAVHSLGADRGIDVPFAHTSVSKTPDSLIADFLSEYTDLAAEVVSASGSVRAPVMAAIFIYALHDHARAIEFAREVSKGIGLSEDAPAYRLRQSIERMKRANDASGRMDLFKTTVSAISAHTNGKTTKLLRPSDSWVGTRWDWQIKTGGLFA